jgi:2-phospho-L-lactate transferase/gluconeogenesis factor (CofD/UPF0052 family)
MPRGVSHDAATISSAVTDDGGSSGRVREEFNMLPPATFATVSPRCRRTKPCSSRLFQYRFRLTELAAAAKPTSPPAPGALRTLHLVPPDVQPLPQTLAAIASADLITIGPGSLFTSLVPNLLVQGILEAVAASPAVKVLVCNLMSEANESLGLSAADHIRVLTNHVRTSIFGYALVNVTPASAELKTKYAEERARQIVADVDGIEALGVNVILGDYLEEVDGVAWHATERVS